MVTGLSLYSAFLVVMTTQSAFTLNVSFTHSHTFIHWWHELPPRVQQQEQFGVKYLAHGRPTTALALEPQLPQVEGINLEYTTRIPRYQNWMILQGNFTYIIEMSNYLSNCLRMPLEKDSKFPLNSQGGNVTATWMYCVWSCQSDTVGVFMEGRWVSKQSSRLAETKLVSNIISLCWSLLSFRQC